MYAQGARRLRRAKKRQEWLKQNNKTFSISGKASTNTLSLKRKPAYKPKSPIGTSVAASREVKEYKNQIIRATYLFNCEFKRKPLGSGPVCLPEVAIYTAGFSNIRKGAAHIIR